MRVRGGDDTARACGLVVRVPANQTAFALVPVPARANSVTRGLTEACTLIMHEVTRVTASICGAVAKIAMEI